MTVGDLIRLALLNAGVVKLAETIYAEDVYLGSDMLQTVVAQWQQRRWIVPALAETVVPCTGALSYSVGIGGDVPMVRPANIEDAFIRLLAQGGAGGSTFDYPMTMQPSREDYNQICLKGLNSFPGAVYYSPSLPMGELFIWPVPNNAYELHMFSKSVLPDLSLLSGEIAFPPEYAQGLIYTLACALRPLYSLPPDPTLIAQMRAAMNTIRNANLQVPVMSMPGALHSRPGQSLAQLMGGVW